MRLNLTIKLLLFFVSLSFNPVFSQETVNIKFEKGKVYRQSLIDSIMKDTNIKLSISDFKKILESDKKLIGWTKYYTGKANVSYRENVYDSTIYYANKAIETYSNSPKKRELDEKQLLTAYYTKAKALHKLNEFNQAIINYQKALDYCKKYPYEWKSYISAGIARSHKEVGNDSIAIKYYTDITKDSLFMNDSRASITTLTSIGTLYKNLSALDSAQHFFNKALTKSYNSDYKSNLATIYYSLGLISNYNKQKDSVYYYFKKGVDANTEYGIGSYVGAIEDNAIMTGYVKYNNGEFVEAKMYFNKAIKSFNAFENLTKLDKNSMIFSIEILGEIYSKLGEINEHNALLKTSINFLEKYYSKQIEKELSKLEIIYQIREKDALISQLEKNKEQQGTIINQQKVISFGLGSILLLLVSIGYLFWRQRKINSQYEKENLQQRLLRTQMNPHFIGNAMNNISALVQKKSDNAIPYINKFSNLFRLVLNNSREEFVSLENELTALESYLELQSNFSEDFDFSFFVDDSINKVDYIIPPMLIQPFVENAVLHGLSPKSRSKIHVKITKNAEGLLLCEIVDNGIGYSNSTKDKFENRKSVSGDIIRERLQILKKKFKINSRYKINSDKNGTQVSLYLPYLLDT